ncbi:MAG: DUF3592 domain-containing protein [Candidatus Hydrogenedentes bacterium]|nr:DUF3592 domain-containing protein [Candidatus Hydrogenedentota bacterium]
MPVYSRRRFRKLGFPEFLLVCALLLAVAPLTLFWLFLNVPEWPATGGWVVSGEVESTHYNAQDYARKVNVAYEYRVGSVAYKGAFVGLWPGVGSPNALAPENIKSVTEQGHPLTVFYNPNDPSRSRLHTRGTENRLSLFLIAGCCVALSGIYCFLVYPAWRRS